MNPTTTVLLVDDHTLLRGVLASRLNAEADLNVVGSVANATDAITAAQTLQPDVLLMDIDMPGLWCFDAVPQLRQVAPNTRVVFLSAFFNDRYIEQALDVQAWGYITKDEPEEVVVGAIRKVAAGVAYFSPPVQERIVVEAGGARLAAQVGSRVSTLTDREIQVLRYLARGLSKKQIATTMTISTHTVNRHATSLMSKLDIHDRVELARYAIREGLAGA